MLSIRNQLNGTWEQVRGSLQRDLQTIVTVLNTRWAATLGDRNQLSLKNNVQGMLMPSNGGSAGWTIVQDATTVFLNPGAGTVFYLEASGNRTITITGTPTNGQWLTLVHKAAGGSNRTPTLTTGSGQFRFGATFPALSATTSALTDYITCLYNGKSLTFDVVWVTKGF